MEGTVKFFNERKGFGFIKPDNGSAEIFVHATGLENRSVVLQEGDKVEYETKEGRKGPNAVSVRKI